MKETAEHTESSKLGTNWRAMLPIGLVLMVLAVCYAAMATKYRAYDTDDPWYQAISYNTWNLNIDTDTFTNCRFPAGMGGSRNFGELASLIQATFLNRVGWYQWNGAILSAFFVLLSFVFWNFFLKNLGWSRVQRALYILSLGLLEPFVSMACKSRYDFFSFFVLSITLWLASRRLNYLAIAISFLAVETQPIGIVVPFAILLFLLFREKARVRLVLFFVLASVIGAGIHIWIHPLAIATMTHADWHNRTNDPITFGFLNSYFLDRKRHLPELIVLLFAAVMYWRRRSTVQNHFAVAISLVVYIVSCILRANVAYMVFFYPFLLLAAWPLLKTTKSMLLVTGLTALYLLPQYGVLLYINRHEGYDRQDIASVSRAISSARTSMHVSDDQVQVYGEYSLWYAHPRNYVSNGPWTHDSVLKADVLLCYDSPIEGYGLIEPLHLYCPDIWKMGTFQQVEQLSVRGHLLHVLTPIQSSAQGAM
jgi:hypothetical protein